jgi:hypothetical protein
MLIVAMLSAFAMYATAASATVVHICVPEKAGTAITSNGTAEACKEKETAVQLPASATEQKTLISILPDITFKSAGVDSKPTILFSKANIQVVNGEGKTATANGEGNIVIGYNETPGTETGSHNLVLGGTQDYTSYAGILGGNSNTAQGPFATLVGEHNKATEFGKGAFVAGHYDDVSQHYGSITGGCGNSVGALPGGTCTEFEEGSTVTGGHENDDVGKDDVIVGGANNVGQLGETVVLGGANNEAFQRLSTISGGTHNRTAAELSSVAGGTHNEPAGEDSSISGGTENKTTGFESSVVGGEQNKAAGARSVVVGGQLNEAGGELNTILGGGGHFLGGLKEIFPE